MKSEKRLAQKRRRRAFRVRNRVRGTPDRPRITVFRTNHHLWAQVIDDEAGKTLCASSTKSLGLAKGWNVPAAKAVGEDLGKKAKALGLAAARFDRGAYRFHGRVKALADAVRAAGVKF